MTCFTCVQLSRHKYIQLHIGKNATDGEIDSEIIILSVPLHLTNVQCVENLYVISCTNGQITEVKSQKR